MDKQHKRSLSDVKEEDRNTTFPPLHRGSTSSATLPTTYINAHRQSLSGGNSLNSYPSMHLANEASPFFLSHSIWNPVNTTSSFGHQRNSKSISQPTRMDTIDEKGRDILGGPTASAGSDICDFIREPISNTDHRTTAAGPPTHLQPPHGFPVTPQSHGLPLPLNRQAAPEAHPTGWDQAFTSNPALRGPQSMQQFVQGELIPFLNRRLIVRTPPPEITCAIEFAGRTTHYLRTTEADPNFPENIRRAIYYPATATPFYQTLLREPMSLVIFVMINWQRRNGRLELHDQGLALVGVAAGLEGIQREGGREKSLRE